MNIIQARNPHQALPVALDLLFRRGVRRDSRNGPVLQIPEPTCICYEKPTERVIFHPLRNANPFFHLMESLWMLAGRQDVAFVSRYVKTMSQFSDNGVTFNGAYGFRWRYTFNVDQVEAIITALRRDKSCRRQVLTMWSPETDLGSVSKDVPCNTHIYFAINHLGSLDMTVCNRSNDLVWGALGANCVHMSVLQEYVANGIGVPVGRYYQFTNNLHGYLKTAEPLQSLIADQGLECPYSLGQVTPSPVFGVLKQELYNLDNPDCWVSPFMVETAKPVAQAYSAYTTYGAEVALPTAENIFASDWRKACVEWLGRKIKGTNDGVNYGV